MYQQPQHPQQPQSPMPFPSEFRQDGFPPQGPPPPQQPFYGGPPPPMILSNDYPLPEAQTSGIVVSSIMSIKYGIDLYDTFRYLFDSDRYDNYELIHFKRDVVRFLDSFSTILLFSFFIATLFSPNFFGSGKSTGYKMWMVSAAVLVELLSSAGDFRTVSMDISIAILVYLCYADDSKYPLAQSLRPWRIPITSKSDES